MFCSGTARIVFLGVCHELVSEVIHRTARQGWDVLSYPTAANRDSDPMRNSLRQVGTGSGEAVPCDGMGRLGRHLSEHGSHANEGNAIGGQGVADSPRLAPLRPSDQPAVI